MFTDPISITINGVTVSLPRIITEGSKATYQASDSNLSVVISHQNSSNQRVRSMVRADQRFIVPDPLTAVNDYETCGVHIVIDRPEAGLSATQIDNLLQGLKGFLTTANVTKIVGREI